MKGKTVVTVVALVAFCTGIISCAGMNVGLAPQGGGTGDQVDGGVAKPDGSVYQYMPLDSRNQGTEILLSEACKEISGKVYYELKEKGENYLGAKIAVVTAVPLADLKRETEFGRVIAEYLLTDFADRGMRVTELRLGQDISILPRTGEFIMSRNIGELANNSPELDYVVVSTFSNTRKTLILQGRLVSLSTGLVETSWRYNLPLNRELLGLFQKNRPSSTIAMKGMIQ